MMKMEVVGELYVVVIVRWQMIMIMLCMERFTDLMKVYKEAIKGMPIAGFILALTTISFNCVTNIVAPSISRMAGC